MNGKISCYVCLVVVGSMWPLSQGCVSRVEGIRTAVDPVKATPEAVEIADGKINKNAREARREWQNKSFEEFEKSVYKEPGEGGKYIVSGDTAISGRKRLEEFFETRCGAGMMRAAKDAAGIHLAPKCGV